MSGLLADAELEAPPGRRLLVFAASYLGLLAFAQANFASGIALLAPPVAMAIVLLIAVSGLLLWIRGRWSRALLHLAAGIATLAGAAAAVLLQTVVAVSMVLLLLGITALTSGAISAAGLVKDAWPVWRRRTVWIVLASASLVGLLAVPVPGARLGSFTAIGCIVLGWLLRPADAPVEPKTA